MSAPDFVARARRLGYFLVGLSDLADKYQALAELRAGEPGRTTLRRDAMRKVAERFPAALREFDEASGPELERRARDLDETLAALVGEVEQGSAWARAQAPERAWMRASSEVHAYLREILKIKRWLAGRAVTDALFSDFAGWHRDSGDPRWSLEHWSKERLGRIARPPRGQVTQVAYEDIAAGHGLAPATLRQILFPREDEPAPRSKE